jgi:hypothetical protein
MFGKRLLLFAAAGSLCVTAALAIAILLFSEFGETQSRILMTTVLIGAFGLLALPAGVLFDQGRWRGLALLLVTLCGLGFAAAIAVIWTPDSPAALGKTMGTLAIFAAAAAQTAALAARRADGDARIVRRLFVASCALAFVVASMLASVFWGEIERETYFRFLAALAVADVLTVALQPILARLRSEEKPTLFRFHLYLESGEELDLELAAPTFVKALAGVVTIAEREGAVTRIDRKTVSPSSSE